MRRIIFNGKTGGGLSEQSAIIEARKRIRSRPDFQWETVRYLAYESPLTCRTMPRWLVLGIHRADYQARVLELEAEGLTRSDAQGVADAEIRKQLN